MPATVASAPLRLALFYAGYFLALGVLTPFWPVFLAAKGMGPPEIGLLLTLAVLVRLVASPVISRIAERSGEYRRPAAAAGLAALLLAVPLFWAEGFWALLAASTAAFFAFSCMIPLAETVTLKLAPVERHYGRIRLWGSVSFILGAGAGGLVLDRLAAPSADAILILVLATLLLAALGALLLPDAQSRPLDPRARSLRKLVKSPAFALMLAAASFLSASHTVYYGFATLHWQRAGLSNTAIGLLWAEGVLAEILLFAFGARIAARTGAAALLALAGLAGLLRWSATAASAEPTLLALVQLLHAGTFGAAHLGVMQFIGKAVPDERAVAAQGAYAAIAGGAATGLGLFGSGWLYGAFGAGAFLFAAALSGLGLLAALLLARVWKEGEVLE